MGRRRRKRVKKVRRVVKPTRYFQCPRCGSFTLTVDLKKSENRGAKKALVRCGTCGIYCVFMVPEALERIDVYNMVADATYDGRLGEMCVEEAGEESVGEGTEPAIQEEG
jgi:transcription elongation factor Elf1